MTDHVRTPSGRLLLSELAALISANDTEGEMTWQTRVERYARKDAYRIAADLCRRYVLAAEYEALGLPEPGQEPDPEDSGSYWNGGVPATAA